jgi:hypothetical protein
MSFNHPSQLRKFMKVGTVWSRVNHQYPDQVGGEVVTEKGTPVQVQVYKVDKDGVALELLGRPGTISFLSWPDPLYMQMFTEPNEIRIENRYGPLLTYTRDVQQEAKELASAVLEGEDPKAVFRAAIDGRTVGYMITWVDRGGGQHVSRLQGTSEEDTLETLRMGYGNVAKVTGIEPMSANDYLDHYGSPVREVA